MAGKKKQLYPGIKEAEQQRGKCTNDEPNYIRYGYKTEEEYLDKELHWSQEKILVWFNID